MNKMTRVLIFPRNNGHADGRITYKKKMFSVNFCVFFGFLQRNSLTLIVGVLCNGRIIKRVNHDYGTPFRQILIIATVPKRMKKLGT